MSHPSTPMQFRIIKKSVACPNPILTCWCKISTRWSFLNATLQLSKHLPTVSTHTKVHYIFSLSLYCWVAGVVSSGDAADARLTQTLTSLELLCSWCVCAYGLAVRRLLEGTPDYTQSSAAVNSAPLSLLLYGQRGFLLSFLTTIVKWAKCSF